MGCILLIDDDALQLRVRETVLRQAGFEVCVATTGGGGMAVLRTGVIPVEAVVTDHFLPDGGGPDLVRRIRQLRPDLLVVLLTGHPGAEDEYRGLNVHFRLKPCPPGELIALLRAQLRRAA